MSAEIILLDTGRNRHAQPESQEKQEFRKILNQALVLKNTSLQPEPDQLAVMDWGSLHDWIQGEIDDEVFQKQLLEPCILASICFVSELLTQFAKNNFRAVCIEEHIESYGASGSPEYLLRAANSAFLYLVFWPETRTNRSIKYHQMARDFGPGLYANYGNQTRNEIGLQMSKAFEPIGHVTRTRLTNR